MTDERWLEKAYRRRAEELEGQIASLKEMGAHPEDKGDLGEGFVIELIKDFLPYNCQTSSGHVLSIENPTKLGKKHDIVVYIPGLIGPVYKLETETPIFPFECVAGAVEVTTRLDKAKLKKDLARLCEVRRPNFRSYYLSQGPNSHSHVVENEIVPPRCWMFGAHIEDFKDVESFAASLRSELTKLHGAGEKAFVHGVWAGHLGYFVVAPGDKSFPVLHLENGTLLDFAHDIAVGIHRFPVVPPRGKPLYGYKREGKEIKIIPELLAPAVGVYPNLEPYWTKRRWKKID